MNRVSRTWIDLKAKGRKALIPYLTPEYPFKGMTIPLLQRLARAGADLIEVGIPFSDPLADGKTIQHSSEVALRNGASLDSVLRSVAKFREDSDVPVILMGYYNSVVQYGLKKFSHQASSSGVDGLIVADLPPEEASELINVSKAAGLSNIFLIAPTSPVERIGFIDSMSTDFTYCVSVTGVTGARKEMGTTSSLGEFLSRVKQASKKPFVVGFGISHSRHVKEVWRYADGAVVGSALIGALEHQQTMDAALDAAEAFFRSLRSES
jgi:tryptophan synthase alpha chain